MHTDKRSGPHGNGPPTPALLCVCAVLASLAAAGAWAGEKPASGTGVPPVAQKQNTPAPIPAPVDDGGVRIKDVAEIFGVRENQLVGQGLIVGLDGCGDKTGTLSPQALSNFLSRQGLSIPAAQLKPKNIAVVAVIGQLPPYVRKGSKIDVQVSSLGDATSLQGGVLLQTPLQGADGRVYAVAQGAISIGGYNASSGGEGGASVQKNHALTGRIPNGALVEREVETTFARDGVVRVMLRKPDFTDRKSVV
jgi:flagellar P-ring protein FlgI